MTYIKYIIPLVLVACSQMPATEGPTAQLMPHVDTPRKHPRIEVNEHDGVFEVWGACLGVMTTTQATLSIITLSPYLGCAWVPHDPDNICIIHVLRGDDYRLKHEIRHCHGWDHPNRARGSDSK